MKPEMRIRIGAWVDEKYDGLCPVCGISWDGFDIGREGDGYCVVLRHQTMRGPALHAGGRLPLDVDNALRAELMMDDRLDALRRQQRLDTIRREMQLDRIVRPAPAPRQPTIVTPVREIEVLKPGSRRLSLEDLDWAWS